MSSDTPIRRASLLRVWPPGHCALGNQAYVVAPTREKPIALSTDVVFGCAFFFGGGKRSVFAYLSARVFVCVHI